VRVEIALQSEDSDSHGLDGGRFPIRFYIDEPGAG